MTQRTATDQDTATEQDTATGAATTDSTSTSTPTSTLTGRDASGRGGSVDAAQDVAGLGYEAARDELVDVVRRLEAGGEPLEASLALWERGEALAARCQQWLDGARARLDASTAKDAGGNEVPQTVITGGR